MATMTVADSQIDAGSKKSFYDRRRKFGEVLLPAKQHLSTPVFDAHRAALLATAFAQARIEADLAPLPAPIDRESYYGDRHLEYWLSGLQDANNVMLNCDPDSGRYLDFGGCSGRVARHFVGVGNWQPWVCDINVNYVDWIEAHLSEIAAFQNRPQPHLPFEDGFFDVVSAFSVFTHLDNDEIPWLLELRRVTRPGGMLFLTVMDEYCWEEARKHDWLLKSIGNGGNEEALRSALGKPIPADRFVLRYHDDDAYNVNVFLRQDYIRKRWGRFFSELSISPGIHNHQTGILLRK